MNLAFNFEDELFWVHNVLPLNLYKEMYIEVIRNRKKLNFKKSLVNWRTYKEEVNDMSMSYGQEKYEENILLRNFFREYHIILKHNPFVNFLNYEFDSHLRLTKYNQHLAWHNDSCEGRTYAVTYYFNRTWGESWGGELMFKNSKGSGFIPVLGNSMCIVKTGLKHKVSSVLKKTHNRFSIQTWVTNGEKN